MKAAEFNTLLHSINDLTDIERKELSIALQRVGGEEKVLDMIESRFKSQDGCPHCGAIDYQRHGHAHGLQRYRCKDCKKTFNSLTGTPLARLRNKKQWFSYLNAMSESKTVRDSAKLAGVHRNTSFRWRHRFLSWMTNDLPVSLGGITEADETFILESEKGNKKLDRNARKRGGPAGKRGGSGQQVCILVARDRAGQTVDFITGRGSVSTDQLEKYLHAHLSQDVLLVSDGGGAYKKYANKNKIAHKAINMSQKKRVDGAYHIQNVNSYHRRLKKWMDRFNGVATKHLGRYLGWRRVLEKYPNLTSERLLLTALGQYQHLTVT